MQPFKPSLADLLSEQTRRLSAEPHGRTTPATMKRDAQFPHLARVRMADFGGWRKAQSPRFNGCFSFERIDAHSRQRQDVLPRSQTP